MRPRSHRLRIRRVERAWVFSLPREFGAEAEDQLIPATDEALVAGAVSIVLDFGAVEIANSAGIGILVDLIRRARARNVAVVLATVRGQARVICERVGFFALLPSFDSVDEAIAAEPAS